MRRTLLMIVILMLIGCSDNDGGGEYVSTTPRVTIQPVAAANYYKEHKDPVEINLDDLSFTEAFRIEHHAKGEGRTFWWRGNEYTTNLRVSTNDIKYPSVDAE